MRIVSMSEFHVDLQTPFFNFKNGGIPFVLPSANLYQKTRASDHTRNPKQKITTSLNFFSYQTLIIST